MTVQINIGDHVSPEANYLPFPGNLLGTMRWVRRRAFYIVRNHPSANTYFSGIAAGSRTLSQLLADNSIWVNYNPTITDYGETTTYGGFGKECCIAPAAFQKGKWMVLATFIHELAHCNGAAGGSATAAEDALPHCGLGSMTELRTRVDDPETPYDPGIEG